MTLAELVPLGQRQEQGNGGVRVDDHQQGTKVLTRKKVSTGTGATPQNAWILKGQS